MYKIRWAVGFELHAHCTVAQPVILASLVTEFTLCFWDTLCLCKLSSKHVLSLYCFYYGIKIRLPLMSHFLSLCLSAVTTVRHLPILSTFCICTYSKYFHVIRNVSLICVIVFCVCNLSNCTFVYEFARLKCSFCITTKSCSSVWRVPAGIFYFKSSSSCIFLNKIVLYEKFSYQHTKNLFF